MAATDGGDPWLFTPGPLTTSPAVKAAMARDLGSRDADFIALGHRVRAALRQIAGGGEDYDCVPLQGSGTFSVEAMLGSFVPRRGGVLVLSNGAYGRRMAKICEVMGRAHRVLSWRESEPVQPQAVDRALADMPELSHVAIVHCETTTGLLNPVEAVAEVVRARGRELLVDAMSAFGALPLPAAEVGYAGLAASSNKCVQGLPGVGFVIARRDVLAAAEGQAHALSLDLHDQWLALERNGQWRFTPPVQVMLGLDAALRELAEEGGPAARLRRYQDNCDRLRAGMIALGFRPLLPEDLQAPIIVTFQQPEDPAFDFPLFYAALRRRGFVIYSGKLTEAETFRIGCIGALGAPEVNALLAAMPEVMTELHMSL